MLSLWPDFDIISYKFGNSADKFVFQHNRDKVKVTVAVRRKLHCSDLLVFRLILI